MELLQSLVASQSRLVVTPDPSSDSVLGADAICVEVPTDEIRVIDFWFYEGRLFQSMCVSSSYFWLFSNSSSILNDMSVEKVDMLVQ